MNCGQCSQFFLQPLLEFDVMNTKLAQVETETFEAQPVIETTGNQFPDTTELTSLELVLVGGGEGFVALL
jgi:hypothetical protein